MNSLHSLGFELGGLRVGGGARCVVIAEAGVNHNGSPELAEKLIDIAADAAADIVKFQTFDPEALAGPEAAMAEYQASALGDSRSQLDMLKGLTLPLDAYDGLLAHARRRGILFLSTPFDARSADFLERLDLPAFKISSGDLTNSPLLRHIAKKHRPMLVSTGMGTMGEIAGALDAISQAGAPPVALFHCVSNYPTAPADCNLRALSTLTNAFRRPTGWSDHTMGVDISVAAVALGAELVEKHITLDRSLPGPDHKASLTPDELRHLVAGIRDVEAALGDGLKVPRPSEAPVAAVARRSLHWARSLEAGAVIRDEDLVVLRPSSGIAPAAWDWVVGRVVQRAVVRGRAVTNDDLFVRAT